MSNPTNDAELLASISRPHPRLLLKSVVPAIIVVIAAGVFIALWLADVFGGNVPWQIALAGLGILIAPFAGIVRYYTLSYQIDDSGLRMGVGLINRRESYVTFARVQDIHLDRSLIDRLLGLGTISIQTASGQSAAEVRLFGLRDPEPVRDALYRRLRRHQGIDEEEEAAIASLDPEAGGAARAAEGSATAAAVAAGGAAEESGPSAGTAACPPLAGAAADASVELSQLLRQLADATARLTEAIQRTRLVAPAVPLPQPPPPSTPPTQPPPPTPPGPGVIPGIPGTSPGPVAAAPADVSPEHSPLTPPALRITDPSDSAEGLR